MSQKLRSSQLLLQIRSDHTLSLYTTTIVGILCQSVDIRAPTEPVCKKGNTSATRGSRD